MNIPFYKYQGTGNDFILIDNRQLEVSLATEQVKNFATGGLALALMD